MATTRRTRPGFCLMVVAICGLVALPADAQSLGELLRRKAEAAATEGQIDAEKRKRTHQFLASPDATKRSGAYAAMRALGEDYREEYGEMLVMAKGFHRKALDKVVADAVSRDRATGALVEAHAEWHRLRGEALQMVQTNWKEVPGEDYRSKHKEMDGAFAEAEAAYGRRARAAKPAAVALARLTEKTSGPLAALGEIERELAWCDGREFDDDDAPSLANAELEKAAALVDLLDSERKTLGTVAAHNASSGWAGEPLKAFAALLNARRAVLGLQVLRLDARLSAACAGHSAEMGRLGYFAHTSPVEENRSFGDRARNHEFEGQATGECIYAGGGGAKGSHTAWWYSDGHRLIMYAGGPNTLGLGTAGSLWTLNTGRKNWGE